MLHSQIVRETNYMTSKALHDQLAEVMFTLARTMKDGMTFDSDTAQLTVLQLQALIFVCKQESVTMTEVANKFKISLPTASALSDKLVNASLIKRENDKTDRRIVKLVLTEKGTALLTEAMKQRTIKIDKMLSYLPQKEKEQLLHIMKSLLQNIQKNNEK
jgi:DNA-binding MarR family transcriptional regulator